MHTVVARFHDLRRDLAEIEDDLIARGAKDARITGYTVAMTIEAESREDATKVAHKLLDRIGATRIKITKHGGKYAKAATPVGDDAR